MPFTTYAINQMLNQYFGGSSACLDGTTVSGSEIVTWYLGLSTTAIDATGSTVTEPTTGCYVRLALSNDTPVWTRATSGSLNNIATTSASFRCDSTAWGNIVSAFLSPHATETAGSSIWFYYTFSPAIVVQANSTLPVPAGSITAQIT